MKPSNTPSGEQLYGFLGASLVASLSLWLVGNDLAQWLLHQLEMSSVFCWLALTLPAMAANTILLAIV